MGLVSRNVWLGVAAEATSGTLEAAPKVFIPVETGISFGLKPTILRPKETRGNRAAVTVQRQGGKIYEGKAKGVWYNDSTSALMRSVLGADTITQPASVSDPTVYDHALKMANTSPISQSFFLNVFQATNYVNTYSWGVVDKFKLSYKVKDGFLAWEADFMAIAEGYLTGSVPTPSWTTLLPPTGWEAQVSKGGSRVAGVTDAEVEFSNDYEPFFGSVTGTVTQNASEMMPGEHAVKGKFSILLTRADYELFTNDTEEAFQLVFERETISNAYKQTLTVSITRIRYSGGDRDNGEKLIMLKCEFDGVYDSSTSTTSTVTVRNNKALSYY